MLKLLRRYAVCGLLLSLLASAQSEDKFNVNQRILRIRNLGKKNATVLPALSPYLADSNLDIRIEAVKAIVRVGGPESLDLLVKAAHDNDAEVQIRATDGIVNVYLPGYVARSGLTGSLSRGVKSMKSFFSSRNDQIVEADVVIRPDAAQVLSDLVGGGASSDSRANAALASGILRDRLAVPVLVQALHAKDSDLIFESLVALQKIQDPGAGSEAAFLTRDLDARIQATALETVTRLRTVSAAPDVRSALQNARDARIRRAALKALATFGVASDRATFLQYARDRDVELRASALEGLGRVREPEDFPLLQQAYDEGEVNWRIHLAAAFAMVNEGKSDVTEFDPLPYLVENLRTKSHSELASAYLAELVTRDDVRASLNKMMPDMDREQKVALCSAYATAATPEVIPTLDALAKDIDPNVAYAAAKALKAVQARKPS